MHYIGQRVLLFTPYIVHYIKKKAVEDLTTTLELEKDCKGVVTVINAHINM